MRWVFEQGNNGQVRHCAHHLRMIDVFFIVLNDFSDLPFLFTRCLAHVAFRVFAHTTSLRMSAVGRSARIPMLTAAPGHCLLKRHTVSMWSVWGNMSTGCTASTA